MFEVSFEDVLNEFNSKDKKIKLGSKSNNISRSSAYKWIIQKYNYINFTTFDSCCYHTSYVNESEMNSHKFKFNCANKD